MCVEMCLLKSSFERLVGCELIVAKRLTGIDNGTCFVCAFVFNRSQ